MKIKRNDPQLKKIYAEIIEHDRRTKVKPEKIKYERPQILKYLKKRYLPRLAEIVCQNLNFPHKGSYDDYC